MEENSIKNTKLLSPNDLAKILNISIPTVYRLIESRTISFYKIGGSLRFSEKDVVKYLEENRIEEINRK